MTKQIEQQMNSNIKTIKNYSMSVVCWFVCVIFFMPIKADVFVVGYCKKLTRYDFHNFITAVLFVAYLWETLVSQYRCLCFFPL